MSVPIVDMRLRPPLPQWAGSDAFKSAMWYARKGPGFLGARSAWTESMDELIAEMDASGIRYGVIIGRASFGAGALGNFDNASMIDALDKWPNYFLGFLGMDLEKIPQSIKQVRELAGHKGVKGISIEPGSSKTPRLADDKALMPIYDLASELKLPVSISLSGLLSALAGHDLTWCSPIPVQRVAFKYPQLPIICSHASWPYVAEMVSIALTCPNIYISPDVYISTAFMPCAQTYIDAANCYLSERTLWGTAYPSRGHAEAVRDTNTFNWAPGVLDKAYWHNAARLLNLTLDDRSR